LEDATPIIPFTLDDVRVCARSPTMAQAQQGAWGG
jgi:hypothetical protein